MFVDAFYTHREWVVQQIESHPTDDDLKDFIYFMKETSELEAGRPPNTHRGDELVGTTLWNGMLTLEEWAKTLFESQWPPQQSTTLLRSTKKSLTAFGYAVK